MAKNKNVQEAVLDNDAEDTDYIYDPKAIPGWENEELLDESGFKIAPYVEAYPGLVFAGIPVYLDVDPDRSEVTASGAKRNPFDRWVFQALHPIKAARGPKGAEQTIVKVLAGEFFAITYYKQLRIAPYLGLPIELTCNEKIQMADRTKKMWDWSMRVTKDTKAKLAAKRAEMIAQISASNATPSRQVSA